MATTLKKHSKKRRRPALGKTWLTWVLGVTLSGGLLIGLAVVGSFTSSSFESLQRQAQAAEQSGDWSLALQHWRSINATRSARASSHLGEARACLALSRAGQAELSLRRAISADPADPEPWRLLLQILRVEDRTVEIQQLGWNAYDEVLTANRRDILRELTLGLLAELPDELARGTLQRWVDADPKDLDAQVALWQRITAQPRAIDPDRPSVLSALEAMLAEHPAHIGARDALVAVLADAGEPDRGRTVIKEWPEANRDARYWRARGRWELEYDHQPEQAINAFRTAIAELPQDWRSWYRLARALRVLNREKESREAAESVSRIREALEPRVLESRLDAVFNNLNDDGALHELSTLCRQAGLARLANAWLAEIPTAQHPAAVRPSPPRGLVADH